MGKRKRWMLAVSGAAGLLGISPAVAATVFHSRSLRKKRAESILKEHKSGQRYPDLPVADIGQRNMPDIMERLSGIPFNPKPYGGLTSTLLFSLTDVIPMMLETRKSTCGKVFRYPDPFKKVVLHSEDDTPLCAVIAIHDDGRPRPAILMVHGLFGSKNIWFSQQVVLSAYYGWGYNVMALDLRFFGESKLYSESPGTGGWKEGQDIIAAVKHLKSMREVTSVGVMGGSYGAAAAMCAAYQSEPKDLIDGGIISWGGYGYVLDQVGYISKMPKPWKPFFPVYLYFMSCFAATLGKKVLEFRRFEDLLLRHSASYYEVGPDAILHNSSAALHFDEIRVPTLVINADDDPVIPASQSAFMADRAEDNPWIEVWRMPRGGHCAFAVVDKKWMGDVARTFFNYWAKSVTRASEIPA